VFFWEYFGPLVTYALFYFFPRVFYPGYKCALHRRGACMRSQLSRNPAGLLDSLAGFLDSLGSAARTQIDVCEKAVGHAAGAEPSLVHVVGRAPLALFLHQYTKFFVP